MTINIDNISDINQIDEYIKILENKRIESLKNNGFPYIDIFNMSTNAGEEVEKLLCKDIFYDLKRVGGKNYDQISLNSNTIAETKTIRMMVKGSGGYYERALSITDQKKGYVKNKKKYGGNISTCTFQQVKSKEFEYMFGVILFKDGMDIFLIPSNKIGNPKEKTKNLAYLSGQHKGNVSEGQLNYNDKVLNDHYLFSIYNDNENLYYYDRTNKLIGEIFTKLSIENIIYEKFSI